MTKGEKRFFYLEIVAGIALLGFTLFGEKLMEFEKAEMVWCWGMFLILGSFCGVVVKICRRRLKQPISDAERVWKQMINDWALLILLGIVTMVIAGIVYYSQHGSIMETSDNLVSILGTFLFPVLLVGLLLCWYARGFTKKFDAIVKEMMELTLVRAYQGLWWWNLLISFAAFGCAMVVFFFPEYTMTVFVIDFVIAFLSCILWNMLVDSFLNAVYKVEPEKSHFYLDIIGTGKTMVSIFSALFFITALSILSSIAIPKFLSTVQAVVGNAPSIFIAIIQSISMLFLMVNHMDILCKHYRKEERKMQEVSTEEERKEKD